MTRKNDGGQAADVVYKDLSKAFDKVPHDRLVEKIMALRIQDMLADWIHNWLADWRQSVMVDMFFGHRNK